MNFHKTDDNAFFSTIDSYEEFKSLVLESRSSCASSNTFLLEENNLSLITDWLYSQTDLNAGCWEYIA